MIDIVEKYQSSIFVDASDITPTPNNVSDLVNMFSKRGLIPNTFQEIGPSGQSMRVRLSSSNNEWNIILASNRINVEKTLTEGSGSNMGELGDFCKEAADILQQIIKHFKMKANRIALINNYILEEMSPSALTSVYSKLCRPPKFYDLNTPFEWNWRSAAKVEMKLLKVKEEFNIITTVKRVKGTLRLENEVQNIDRISLLFDINTVPENKEYRFGIGSIKNFHTKAINLQNKLIADLQEFIYE